MGRLIRGVAFYWRKRPGRLSDEGQLLTVRQDFGAYYSTEATNRWRRIYDKIRELVTLAIFQQALRRQLCNFTPRKKHHPSTNINRRLLSCSEPGNPWILRLCDQTHGTSARPKLLMGTRKRPSPEAQRACISLDRINISSRSAPSPTTDGEAQPTGFFMIKHLRRQNTISRATFDN